MPAPHARQDAAAVAPGLPRNLPATHRVQAASPAVATRPASHATHVAEVAAPLVEEKKPTAQLVHAVPWPAADMYRPGSQLAHKPWPVAAW